MNVDFFISQNHMFTYYKLVTFYRMVCSLCYYALSFGVRTLPGSIYVNSFFSSAVEGLGYVACFSIAWWGRKWPTVASFLGGAVTLLVFALITAFQPGKVRK